MPLAFLLSWTAEKCRHPMPSANLGPNAIARGKVSWYPRCGSRTSMRCLWKPEKSFSVNNVHAKGYGMLLIRTVLDDETSSQSSVAFQGQ
eukprot:15354995-Ditylum_brightwellii.AAC.1